MIYSLGLILILGFILGWLLDKIHIPGLVGMILIGLFFGPHFLNVISPDLLNISSELRQIALVIILTRSGLNLNFSDLKKVGRSAILMCFLPACFEIAGVTLGAYYLLHLSIFESMLLGSVLAAVSPAVVSPRMIKLIDNGYGKEHHVPELILAGASVDDVFVIVLFYAFLGLVQTGEFNALSVSLVPVSILLGVALGVGVGFGVAEVFKRINLPVWAEIIITLSLSFLMIGLENLVKPWISISSLLGIMVMGMILLFRIKAKAKEISNGYNKLWKVFEILLFVLVGASVDLSYLKNDGWMALLVLIIGLICRSIGVVICIIGTKLTWKERVFAIISYLPKATVQASIGGIAASLMLPCGGIILTVSVLAIMVTAPIGALLIDTLHPMLLKKEAQLVVESN